ncbi:hypothetical protein V501_01727 [Pseudogymnoascus sp. VKM F-4519 (FW-2642)]|nr:hypothetical protein V501_01727 [Pseudogymnoascus sp. VKM F-4519 (FW-2642)]
MASSFPQASHLGDKSGARSDIVPSDSGSSSHANRLTPEPDSGDSDFDDGYDGHESIELQSQDKEAGFEPPLRTGDDGSYALPRRGSASTTQSFQLYTPDEERAVVRKFDKRLVLFVALLYMLSFLDRSRNARIAGMDADLNLHSDQYEWILTSFYITYIMFEWMSLLWKIIPAHIYVSVIVMSWGIIASLQALSTSFITSIILRLLLGIGEAGFTGIPYFLSFFYRKEELALRTGLFISAAPLATSFASALAWAILKLGENGPIAPWRLLFLVEGFPSVIVSVIAWHVIPDGPAKAKYLTPRERKVARLRLRRRQGGAATKGGLKWREVLETILDPKAYLTAFMFFFTNMAFSSMPVFLPIIIRSMGHSSVVSQALSAPPYLMSFFVVILTAYLSDRMHSRSTFIIFHALFSCSGYLVLALAERFGLGVWWRYAAIYPAAIGFFSVVTIVITWSINNQESESKQGAGFAMLQLVGQCGPLVGTRLYPDVDAPYYTRGMAGCAGAMVVVATLAIILRFYLSRKNRNNEKQDGGEYVEVDKEEEDTLVGENARRDQGQSSSQHHRNSQDQRPYHHQRLTQELSKSPSQPKAQSLLGVNMPPLKIQQHKSINIAQEDHYELKIINLTLDAQQQNEILNYCMAKIIKIGGVIREQWLPIPRGTRLKPLPKDIELPIHQYIRPNFDGVLGMILFTLPFDEEGNVMALEDLVPEKYEKQVFLRFWEASRDEEHDDQWRLNDPEYIARWFQIERKYADTPWLRRFQDIKIKHTL